jgi:hypothetical protein
MSSLRDPSRISLFRWFHFATFIVLAAVYYVWTWSHELGEFGGDSAIYLLTARHFSPWSDHSDVAAYFAGTSQYPPLFPFILAISGGGESTLVAHLVTTTFLLFAVIAFYYWMLALGFPVLHAGMTAVLFMLLPGVYMEALSVHSENTYLMASLAGLMAATRAEKSAHSMWYWLGALSIAAASLTRGVGITLVVAFIVYLVLWRPARAWLYAFVSALPMLLWNLLHDRQGPSYIDSFVEKYSGISPDDLFSHLGVELNALWSGWVGNFSISPVALPVMGVIGAICLVGMLYRLWLRKLDGLYAAAYLLLILIWPFPAEAQRFVYVIIPVLIAQGLLFAGTLFRGRLNIRYLDAQTTMLLCIFVVALPALMLTANRFMRLPPAELADLRHNPSWYALDPRDAMSNIAFDKLLVDHLRQIEGMVPEGSCVYSIKPSVIGFYANRVSMIPPRQYFDQSAFDAYLKRTNCRYFYLMGFASPSFSEAYYPLSRLYQSLAVMSIVRTAAPSANPVGMLAELVQR